MQQHHRIAGAGFCEVETDSGGLDLAVRDPLDRGHRHGARSGPHAVPVPGRAAAR